MSCKRAGEAIMAHEEPAQPLRILFVASEVTPFARTGGLGDVASALPKALAALGHDVRIVMPLYQAVRERGVPRVLVLANAPAPQGASSRVMQVWRSHLPQAGAGGAGVVPVYFIEQNDYFARPGLYGDSDGDYPDNAERFTFFCRAVMALIPSLDWWPDVLHCHDWQTALLAAYKRFLPGLDARFDAMPLIYTIHNLAYQGLFPAEAIAVTGLPLTLFHPGGVEFYGRLNLMKAGLLYADALTTVSPTYADEICTPEFGAGLEGVLDMRRSALQGIVESGGGLGDGLGESDAGNAPRGVVGARSLVARSVEFSDAGCVDGGLGLSFGGGRDGRNLVARCASTQ